MKRLLRPVPFDLSDESREQALAALQRWLPATIGLALRLKQAHWNLRGMRFKSVHEQLDEILVDVRNAVDDIAERIVTLGGAADGLPGRVAEESPFGEFPAGLLSVEDAIDTVCDDISIVVKNGRGCIAALGEVDPVSEDLAIAVVGALEKHHWMLHSQREM